VRARARAPCAPARARARARVFWNYDLDSTLALVKKNRPILHFCFIILIKNPILNHSFISLIKSIRCRDRRNSNRSFFMKDF
jgi:hypothetical protein